MNNRNDVQFWTNEGNNPKILHSQLIRFIESKGFKKVKVGNANYILVKENNRKISISSETEIVEAVKEHLLNAELFNVYEVFAKGIGSYISSKKLDLLTSEELIDDRDSQNSSTFYFENCYCEISAEGIHQLGYESLNKLIWRNRVLHHSFENPENLEPGQFELFCRNLAKRNDERFLSLKTILGYLLHRNKERGEAKAVILYDENMGLLGQAHGGTGKTLLSQALSLCRESVTFNGKEIKAGSWFKNQRINLTTDILVYDDLSKGFNFETFFPMITSGLEIEKKREHAFYISAEKSPKILISSNYYVDGPGGSSDERRRFEFEVANYYNQELTPEIEFGNRFFTTEWGKLEWDKFYFFMMNCLVEYLQNGLVKVESIRLDQSRLEEKSCQEFVEFAQAYLEINTWLDKRQYMSMFYELYPNMEKISSHKFTKWVTNYSSNYGYEYATKSSGGDYLFILRK